LLADVVDGQDRFTGQVGRHVQAFGEFFDEQTEIVCRIRAIDQEIVMRGRRGVRDLLVEFFETVWRARLKRRDDGLGAVELVEADGLGRGSDLLLRQLLQSWVVKRLMATPPSLAIPTSCRLSRGCLSATSLAAGCGVTGNTFS